MYPLHHDGPWTDPNTPETAMTISVLVSACTGNTETVVIVPVCCRVPVAVGRTHVLWFIVPGATAQHTERLGITLAERL